MVGVQVIKSEEEYDNILKNNKFVAVDFTASWCGPCKMIGPKFEAFADSYANIKFIKVDVDDLSEVSEKAGISAMPTFQFFKDGTKVDELIGASEPKLKEKLDSLK